jgi:hypothetical protein
VLKEATQGDESREREMKGQRQAVIALTLLSVVHTEYFTAFLRLRLLFVRRIERRGRLTEKKENV